MKRVDAKLLKNPLIWFLVLPFLVVGVCNFFISLKPAAYAQVRLAQEAVELRIEFLKKEINILLNQPQILSNKKQINNLCEQLKNARQDLLYFKNDWGSSISEGLATYFKNGTVAVGDAYFPFLVLMWISILFLAIAVSCHRNIPFYLRAGSLSTGSLITLILIAQWIVIIISVPIWYSRVVGLFMFFGFTIALIICWFLFIKKFYIPWSRGCRRKVKK